MRVPAQPRSVSHIHSVSDVTLRGAEMRNRQSVDRRRPAYVFRRRRRRRSWDARETGQSHLHIVFCFADKASQRALEMLIFTENFSGPTFAYFFWFIRDLMLSSEADVTIVMDALKIISKHSEMRGRKSKKLNLNAPKLLPRNQIFDTLIEVIGKWFGEGVWSVVGKGRGGKRFHDVDYVVQVLSEDSCNRRRRKR